MVNVCGLTDQALERHIRSRSACNEAFPPLDDCDQPLPCLGGETQSRQFFQQILERAISVKVAVYAGSSKGIHKILGPGVHGPELTHKSLFGAEPILLMIVLSPVKPREGTYFCEDGAFDFGGLELL